MSAPDVSTTITCRAVVQGQCSCQRAGQTSKTTHKANGTILIHHKLDRKKVRECSSGTQEGGQEQEGKWGEQEKSKKRGEKTGGAE